MNTPDSVFQLVEQFRQQKNLFTDSSYKEAMLRTQFLDPFFEALGWNVRGAGSLNEVVVEDPITIDGKKKSIDYSFKVGDKRKFLVEAKKPATALKTDDAAAFQLRRYTWNASLPLGILTDFEEFAVYDCRLMPKLDDSAHVARLSYYKFEQYPDKWPDIYNLFSREAVLDGKLDAYVEASQSKKGYQTVDAAFLRDIERWREALAKDIASRNPHLNQRDLNFAVQATIDRIIFLRICEDREIEPYERLLNLTEGRNIYERLVDYFQEADDRYNSGLFHFKKDTRPDGDRDAYTLGLKIPDDTLRTIIYNLYWPNIYAFSIIPVEILGQVYEQFLGKVITLDEAHGAKVEEKPEVRKAGGVYYTPAYIVDYIVQNTVGKLLEGKSPEEAAALKIVDPACGSGSFLLGAYRYLLDWYLEQYQKGQKKYAKKFAAGVTDRLSNAEKKQILLNNIFGVDIDPQAVEVTKLSLMLKALEGETGADISQLRLFRERALPDLSQNIKCGNSLIGSDFPPDNLSLEEHRRINPFDWHSAFSAVFRQGGFDAVIGNPPYIRVQALNEWAPLEVEHYKKAYKAASKGNYDIYVVFVERALSLLNQQGLLGYILPHKFFNAQYGQPLRLLLSEGKHLRKVIHFSDEQVFANATTYTCLLFLSRAENEQLEFVKVENLPEWRHTETGTTGQIPAASITAAEWNFTVGNSAGLFDKLNQIAIKLENVTDRIFQGIKTSADKIYIVDEIERVDGKVKIYSKEKEGYYWLETDLLHPLIKGGDSKRYNLTKTNRLILFPYKPDETGKTNLISAEEFERKYPLTWKYLLDNKVYLENRENGRMIGNRWYAYIYPKALEVMPLPKIFTPDIAAISSFSPDKTGELFFTGGVSGGYGILVKSEYSREYVLGLLNSKLLEWIIHRIASPMRGGYFSYESRFIRNLPIRTINFDDPADKARHDRMVGLVERMLDLHRQLAAAHSPHDKSFLQNQINQTDRQIDTLVYELYDLTPEEIKIVEGPG